MYYDHVDTPIGPLLLVSDGAGLVEVGLPHNGAAPPPPAEAGPGKSKLHAAVRQFDEYFAGKRLQFELPLHPVGTPFQLEVWGALLTIPYGETVSYADIARRIRRPRAVRAVGAANGANPLAIIVPCHRVIGATATSPATAGVWRPNAGCWSTNAGTRRYRRSRSPRRADTVRRRAGIVHRMTTTACHRFHRQLRNWSCNSRSRCS